MMKKIIYFVVVILLVTLIVISSYFIYKQLKEENEQESIFDDLHEIIQDNEQNPSEGNLSTNNDINLIDLYKENNDLIGWIKIDNTNIDYPVMQTKDNEEYYLRRNFYKKYSSYGTPFMASNCNIDTSENLIIYGHHMNNSKMFGSLENYKKQSYWQEHKTIKFYTMTGLREYDIFAVFKTTLYQENTFKYYQKIELETKESYNEFIQKCKSLEFYDTGITPKYNKQIITLSTCEYSAKNSRLVVVGVLKN